MNMRIKINRFVFSYLPIIFIIIAPAVPYDNLLFVIGGALIILNRTKSKGSRSLNRIKVTPLLLYLCYTLFITTINIGYLGEYWSVGFKNSVLMIYLFYVLNVYFWKINITKFFDFAEKFYVVIGIMGIIEFIVRFPIWQYLISLRINNYVENSIYTSQYRCVSLFAHPIMYAVFLGIGIVFILYRCANNIKKLVIIEVILAIDLISTQSRSSMFALMILAIFVLLFRLINTFRKMKIKKGFRRILIGIVLIGSASLIYLYFARSNQSDIITNLVFRFQHMLDAGQSGGDIVRIEVARSAFNYLPSHALHMIFGKGLYAGTAYLDANPIFKGTWKWTSGIDNQYITIIFESGLIGLILFLSLFIKEAVRLVKKKNALATKIFVCQLFFLLVSFFYESLLFMSTFSLLVILLLLFENALRENKRVDGGGYRGYASR